MNVAFLELPRRSLACRQCTKSLADEEYCISRYEEGTRCDYCCTCWQLEESHTHTESSPYIWKTRIPKKDPGQPAYLRKETKALAYLKEIIGCENKSQEQYFLSLYLMRKKILNLKKEIDNQDQPYHLFEVVETGEMLPIPKIPLSQLDSKEVQKELATRLSKTG
jgi:hypothetical protein